MKRRHHLRAFLWSVVFTSLLAAASSGDAQGTGSSRPESLDGVES
jgi:hypothetical protein